MAQSSTSRFYLGWPGFLYTPKNFEPVVKRVVKQVAFYAESPGVSGNYQVAQYRIFLQLQAEEGTDLTEAVEINPVSNGSYSAYMMITLRDYTYLSSKNLRYLWHKSIDVAPEKTVTIHDVLSLIIKRRRNSYYDLDPEMLAGYRHWYRTLIDDFSDMRWLPKHASGVVREVADYVRNNYAGKVYTSPEEIRGSFFDD